MAHTKAERSRWATSRSDKTAPIIIEGPYYLLNGWTATTTNHVAVGDLVVITANKVDELEYCADNTSPFGIIPDTVHNWAGIETNNPNVALTKELYFTDTWDLDVAMPIPGTIISCKIEAALDLQFWSPLMAGATGATVIGDDTSPNFGHSLCYVVTGTGTDAIAAYWGAASLTTKT